MAKIAVAKVDDSSSQGEGWMQGKKGDGSIDRAYTSGMYGVSWSSVSFALFTSLSSGAALLNASNASNSDRPFPN